MSVYVGESRGELLAWLNDLLAPNMVKKVEECGKGVIYCQVFDSIYGDVPMRSVKMNPKMEYEYLDNFKILQKAFNKHRIDKRLVKCKMQDNLEFLQWMKKFWDANSRGDAYNAVERAGGATHGTPGSGGSSRAGTRPAPSGRLTGSTTGRVPSGGAVRQPSAASQAQIQVLNAQIQEMQATCEGLEKERDFYFAKLRSIELIVGERINLDGIDPEERDTLAKIQEVLYQTEEGFEVPDGEEGELGLEDDEETF